MKRNVLFCVSALVILQLIIFGQVKAQTNESSPLSDSKLGKAFDGYTLFSPLMSTMTYLINMDGEIVHTWQSNYSSAFSTYFLDSGDILRAASRGGGGGRGMRGFGGGFGGGQRRGGPGGGGVGAGGRIQELDWDGNPVWDFEYYTDREVPHHDIERLPNGNVLIVCWDEKTPEENIAAGRNPQYQTASLPPDCIIEIKPTGKTTGEVVWKWYAWDHLIQDFDPNKPNYGNVTEHPELIDINYSESWMDQPAGGGAGGNRGDRGFGGSMRGFGGGMGGGMMGGGGRIPSTDWTHFNAVAYNEELDQIVVCSYTFSEFWIIDHTTTTEEAASHKGGKYGKGGDLLYRWGNPAAYKCGTNEDQKLFCPHDAHWIAKGLPGEGHLLIFNNGPNRQDGRYSSVDEIVLPVDEKGNYKLEGKTFGPQEPVWSYMDPNDKTNFYATNISSAQRLPNGNTLICVGPSGRFFETTPDKETVWSYAFPSAGTRGSRFGAGQGGFGFRRGSENPDGQNLDEGPPRGRGRGGFGGGGFGMGTQIFRAFRIGADNPALAGKGLSLRKSSEEQTPTAADEDN